MKCSKCRQALTEEEIAQGDGLCDYCSGNLDYLAEKEENERRYRQEFEKEERYHYENER